MNKTKIINLSAFSYEELKEIEIEIQNQLKEKYQLDNKYKKNRLFREENKKKEEKEIHPLLEKFCKEYLQKDDILSFNGTKGSPIRKIIEIRHFDILGLVLKKRWDTHLFSPTGYCSTNSFSKIRGFYCRNGEWMGRNTIIRLMKEKMDSHTFNITYREKN